MDTQATKLDPLTEGSTHEIIPEVNADEIDRLLAPFWRTDDGRTAVERAEAYGIDLSLIEENLRLTPEQRLDRHQGALELMISLHEAQR